MTWADRQQHPLLHCRLLCLRISTTKL